MHLRTQAGYAWEVRPASWLPMLVLVGWTSSLAWQSSGAASAAAPRRLSSPTAAIDRQDEAREEPRPSDRLEKKPQVSISTRPGTRYYAVTYLNLHTRELLPVPPKHQPPRLHSPVKPLKPSRGRFQEDVKRAARPRAERVDDFLRCRATGQATHISPAVMQVSARAAQHFDRRRIDVVSGYRSVKFNELLRKKGHNVASRSRHMRGEALDFALKDIEAEELAPFVARIHRGGIGTYVENDFVHVDVGPDRRWRGK